MNDEKFKSDLISRLSNVERDIAYIKGTIEGRNQGKSERKDNASLTIASISLIASVLLVVSKVFGW